ncbi:Hypothetical predicted protein [Olea europaea subsp. europaea]|uniref:Uncharacterized protein n=1 Tax=Olea europaea subsp. europaea TaxID=158383 RepID=A0A8S0RED3_OLEEU|nr:Hypothetical predicted protein [Olea europaea subsp. europaea]
MDKALVYGTRDSGSRGASIGIVFAETSTNTEALPDVCDAIGVALDGATAASCVTPTASAVGSIVETLAWFNAASHRFRQRLRHWHGKASNAAEDCG